MSLPLEFISLLNSRDTPSLLENGAGIVWVNHMQPAPVEAPWGGYKQSGFGRELGPHGLDEYLEVKHVYISLDDRPIGWYK